MRKLTYILLFSMLFTGCSGIKQGWRNFTAYYNTFYNTTQYYSLGLDQNLRQGHELNPYRPIRIHLPPGSAGANDFQMAIEAGSSILRDHERSKYLLPAIFVIGRSYYYRSEFFSALEKFQELESLAGGRLRQEAFFWQGLTYLEMGNFSEGIQQLEFGLEIIEEWDTEIFSEIQLLLAQLHTAMGNYELAIEYLESGINGISGQNKKGRALFLMGQLHEELNEDIRARYAFAGVNDYRVDFDLEYQARKREAEVSRRLGEFSRAETIFRRLERDDKFLTFRAEMRYEIARTYQLSGKYSEAVLRYRSLLEERSVALTPLIIALSNYGLGEIYRDAFQDYTTASEYFNQAASQRIDSRFLPSDFDARAMAESFGAYARLRGEIARRDSLLGLSMLSDEELEQFILEVQSGEQQRLEEQQRDLRQQEFSQPEGELLAVEVGADETGFGFLNSNNPVLLNEASLQFQTVWGDRPLADNWRRSAVLSGSRFDQLLLLDQDGEEIDLTEETDGGIFAKLNLGDIPFTEEAREQMKAELESLYYELGNVFFLTLDMPDSAAVYYGKVIESGYSESLSEMALYSLGELALLDGREQDTAHYLKLLASEMPGSRYIRRLAERMGLDPQLYPADEFESTAERFTYLVRDQQSRSQAALAAEFIALAEREEDNEARALLLFEAVQSYMRAAREEMESLDPIRIWITEKEEVATERREFERRRDSSRVMLADTTLTEEEIVSWQEISESEFLLAERRASFPFTGAYWDSTRTLLAELASSYPASRVMPRVRILQSELNFPEEPAFDIPDHTGDRMMDDVAGDSELVSDSESEHLVTETIPERVPLQERDSALEEEDRGEFSFADNFSISLYSFFSESRAAERARELAEESFETYICEYQNDQTAIWRVSTGIYPSSASAYSAAEQLREPYDVQNFIQRMNSSCRRIGEPVVSPYGLTGLFSASEEGSYSIVLYSFSNVEMATVAAQPLKSKGFRVLVSERVVDEEYFYRVSVGQFATIREAVSAARALPEPYSNQNFIVRILHSDVQ